MASPESGRPPTGRSPGLLPHRNKFDFAVRGALREKSPDRPDELEAVRARSAFHLHEGCGGDEIVPDGLGAIQPLPLDNVSAGAAPGDSWPTDAAACEDAAREVAARCEAESRSCCRLPAARPARGASARARDIRESNTAPSIRADIASSSLAIRVNRRFRREKRPVKRRDFAPGGLVCQGKSTQLVGVGF